jgi:UDP-glucose 4-epimerase
MASKNSNVKRFIYSASSSCYGLPDIFPTSEESKVAPEYPYALTKRLGEELVLHWCKIYKLPALSLRFFNVYGPKARTSGTYGAVFGVFLAQLLANKPLTIVGDGEQTRDFTYVSDVVSALICACESKEAGEVYNVGSGRTISINHLIKLLGATDIAYIPKRPGEPNCTFADISKIKKALNWMPKVSIESGVKEMLKNKESWRDSPVWTPESIAVATNEWFKYLSE